MKKTFSLLVGGGQDYYGPTADRDRKVVQNVARLLSGAADENEINIQIITGGTAGIPDDLASSYQVYGKKVVDIVSSEYLPKYLERTFDNPRPFWVAGETQEKRRLAFLSNPHITVGLFIQGGPYSAHEMKLFSESGRHVVSFYGSGGAAGGQQAYQGWAYKKPDGEPIYPSDSTDPDADFIPIAKSLVNQIISLMLK